MTQANIPQEQLDEVMAKYDPESNTRILKGILLGIVYAGLLGFSLFQLYTAVFGVFTAQIQRSIHLGFALALIFLLFPASRKVGKIQVSKRFLQIPWYDALLSMCGVVVGLYWPLNINDLVMRVGRINGLDLWVGVLAVLLVLEAARRVVGMPIMVIAVVFLTYPY